LNQQATIVDQLAWIRGIAISPHSKLLATAGNDSTMRLWDLPTGRPRVVLWGHTHKHIECVALSPDGNLLALCGWVKTVRLWRIARAVSSRGQPSGTSAGTKR
jgi:WD40 repeat protein